MLAIESSNLSDMNNEVNIISYNILMESICLGKQYVELILRE